MAAKREESRGPLYSNQVKSRSVCVRLVRKEWAYSNGNNRFYRRRVTSGVSRARLPFGGLTREAGKGTKRSQGPKRAGKSVGPSYDGICAKCEGQ